MQWPQETIQFARRIADDIEAKVGSNKKERARELFLRHITTEYGWGDAVANKTWFRYPHEIQGQLVCGESAFRDFVVAEELGLEPILRLPLAKFVDEKEAHGVIDVDIGRKQRYLIDSVWQVFGPVKYGEETITVRKNPDSVGMKEGFSGMDPVSPELAVEFIEFYKSNHGIIKMLEYGQALYKSPLNLSGVKIQPETNSATFAHHFTPPFRLNFSVQETEFLNLEGKIDNIEQSFGMTGNTVGPFDGIGIVSRNAKEPFDYFGKIELTDVSGLMGIHLKNKFVKKEPKTKVDRFYKAYIHSLAAAWVNLAAIPFYVESRNETEFVYSEEELFEGYNKAVRIREELLAKKRLTPQQKNRVRILNHSIGELDTLIEQDLFKNKLTILAMYMIS